MNIQITGLDALQEQLEHLQRIVEEMHGVENVALSELLTPDFMRRFTLFPSLDALLAATEYPLESLNDLDQSTHDTFDQFIAQTSQCITWDALLHLATWERFHITFPELFGDWEDDVTWTLL
jgi:hypothetical protein